jgi:hypothetical protein
VALITVNAPCAIKLAVCARDFVDVACECGVTLPKFPVNQSIGRNIFGATCVYWAAWTHPSGPLR